jgi:hypothetical protein
MRHLSERRACVRQQRIAGRALREVADPRDCELRLRRACGGGLDRVLVHVGEDRPHAFGDQRLRDGTPDAIPRAGHQRRLARGVERIAQHHVGRSRRTDWTIVSCRRQQMHRRVRTSSSGLK